MIHVRGIVTGDVMLALVLVRKIATGDVVGRGIVAGDVMLARMVPIAGMIGANIGTMTASTMMVLVGSAVVMGDGDGYGARKSGE